MNHNKEKAGKIRWEGDFTDQVNTIGVKIDQLESGIQFLAVQTENQMIQRKLVSY